MIIIRNGKWIFNWKTWFTWNGRIWLFCTKPFQLQKKNLNSALCKNSIFVYFDQHWNKSGYYRALIVTFIGLGFTFQVMSVQGLLWRVLWPNKMHSSAKLCHFFYIFYFELVIYGSKLIIDGRCTGIGESDGYQSCILTSTDISSTLCHINFQFMTSRDVRIRFTKAHG